MSTVLELPARITAERNVSGRHIEMARTAVNILNDRFDGIKLIPAVDYLDGEFPKLPSGQVDAACINGLTPFAGGQANICITSNDLGYSGLNYIFGMSQYAKGNLILSTARLDKTHDGDPYEFMATLVHETAHGFGQVDESARQYDRQSAFSGHCRNKCIMRAANNLAEMQAGAALVVLNYDTTGGFCDNCQDDLSRVSA